MPWIAVQQMPQTTRPATRAEVQQVIEFVGRKAIPRFYADENFTPVAIEILRCSGARVFTVQQVGRRGHPDENHAAYALRNGLILITQDRDYLNERRFPLISSPAIVVCDFGRGTEHEIRLCYRCLRMIHRVPQFFDRWVKFDAKPTSWTEHMRFLDGTTAHTRFRQAGPTLEEWVDG
jgi:predicted nuclease of predicted toxin-antitoxin system